MSGAFPETRSDLASGAALSDLPLAVVRHVDDCLEALRSLEPDDVLVCATQAVVALRALEAALRPLRQDAIHDLRSAGLTYDQIAQIDGLGLSRPRLIQIHQGRARRELSGAARMQSDGDAAEAARLRAQRAAEVERILAKRRS